MATTEQVQKVLSEKRPKLASDEALRKLQEFYRVKSEQGAVVKHEYSLPQLDTVGREIYHCLAQGRGSGGGAARRRD